MMSKEKQKNRKVSSLSKGCILALLAIVIGMSLFTYCDSDPRCNWLGLVGHIIGWIFTYLFGLPILLLPFFLGWLALDLIRKNQIPDLPFKILYFSTALLCLSVICAIFAQASPTLSALAQKWVTSDYYPRKNAYDPACLRHYLGGVPLHHLYMDTAFNLRNVIGSIGTFLLAFTLFLFSASILTHFPWVQIFAKIRVWMKQQLPVTVKIAAPIIKRPFQSEEESEPPPPLVREDPLKKVTRIKISETKPPSEQPLQPLPPKIGSAGNYTLPPTSLLTDILPMDQSNLKNDLKRQAKVLEETLSSFGIEAKVGDIHCGPTITSFEVHPAVGVKVQKIKTLEDDIALNLQAKSIRIIAPIPGKAAVGVEVPNPSPQEVSFRDLLENYLRQRKNGYIPLLLGKVVNGDDIWSDLTKMPHLIIAGATGSGKSVCINTIIMSIVMCSRPDEIKLLMIDPKKVELTAYTHLPHMLAPVITEPGSACAALGWLVKEMERRYEIFRQLGIRNIHGFNTRKINKELEESLDLNIPEKMPFIVVIIDELADLMMVASSDIETPIARIAQMARAVGMHMILATQRPSREVITGLIKANFPCRIAFKVSSRVNSQIIIDENGAETLLGNGDMLFMPPGTSTLSRAQGAFIRDDDINKVIHFCCAQWPTNYLIPSFDHYRDTADSLVAAEPSMRDALYEDAKKLVLETGNASTTFLQRKMKLGYARAASLMDQLEQNGIIGPSEGAKPRKIFYPNQPENETIP